MMTQGAAQHSGRQMGMTAAPCLSPPSAPRSCCRSLCLLSPRPFSCRLMLPPSATG